MNPLCFEVYPTSIIRSKFTFLYARQTIWVYNKKWLPITKWYSLQKYQLTHSWKVLPETILLWHDFNEDFVPLWLFFSFHSYFTLGSTDGAEKINPFYNKIFFWGTALASASWRKRISYCPEVRGVWLWCIFRVVGQVLGRVVITILVQCQRCIANWGRRICILCT